MTNQRVLVEDDERVPEGTVLGTEKPIHYGGRPFLWLSRPNVALQRDAGCQLSEPSRCLPGPGAAAASSTSTLKPQLPSAARGQHQRRRSTDGDDAKARKASAKSQPAAAGSQQRAWNAGAGASRASKGQQVAQGRQNRRRNKAIGVQVNPRDQQLGAEESREASEADHPGDKQSTGRPGKLSSLCDEDKAKVARLIQQVVDLGGEVKLTRSRLEGTQEHAEAKAAEAEAAVAAQEALAQDNARLQSNLAQALSLLRAYQERAEASSPPPSAAQPPPQGSARAPPPPQAADRHPHDESSSPTHDAAPQGMHQSGEEVSPEPRGAAAGAEELRTPDAPFSVVTIRPEETVRVAPPDSASRRAKQSGSVPYLLPWDQEMFSGVPVGFRVPGVESMEYAAVLGSPRARVLRFDPGLGENGAFYFVNASRETSPGQLSDASPGLGAVAGGSGDYGGIGQWSEAAREQQQDEGSPTATEEPRMPSETVDHHEVNEQPDRGSVEPRAHGEQPLSPPEHHGKELQGAPPPHQEGSAAPSASMASTEVASAHQRTWEEATPASRPVPEDARPYGAEQPRLESAAPAAAPSAADTVSPAVTEEVAEGDALALGDGDRTESGQEVDDTVDLGRSSDEDDDLIIGRSRSGVDDEIVAVSVVGSTRAEAPPGSSIGLQRDEPPFQGREGDVDRAEGSTAASAAAQPPPHPLEPSVSTPLVSALPTVPAHGGQSSSAAAQDNRKRDRSFAASDSGGGVSPRLVAPSEDGPSFASQVPSLISSSNSRGTAQSILRDFDDSLLDLVGEVESMHLRASLDAAADHTSASKAAHTYVGTPRSSSSAAAPADRGSSLFPAWSATSTPARASGPAPEHRARPSPHQIPSVGMREENDILAAIADAEDLIQSLELHAFRERNSSGGTPGRM